jgi:hypothetical protein
MGFCRLPRQALPARHGWRSFGIVGLLLAPSLVAFSLPRATAQVFFQNRAVGGVAIDADGVLEAPTVQDQADLARLREQTRVAVPESLDSYTELRAVSLNQLESTIARCRANDQPLPDEASFLAGLLRIRFVFVYPDRQDVVLAGPAEGWKVDALGNVVGRTTNRAVLLLDDLIVALRSGAASRTEPITCSIDPTAEGLQCLQGLSGPLTSAIGIDAVRRRMEDALGPQTITVTGVPPNSHFARTMVAADFRMKRLAMNFEPAPVEGLPSFLTMVPVGGETDGMMPRWWLAMNYKPLARSADGLASELRGPGVKCMTEEDYLDEAGQRRQTGRACAAAQRWAQNLTDRFSELAAHDSSFGRLRNLMDLAVIGALVEKEQLLRTAGLEAPWLMELEEIARFPAPKRTSTKASAVRRRGGWVISASGGVEMLPWQVLDQTEVVDGVSEARSELSIAGGEL